mgnify:CR=1 FL=1
MSFTGKIIISILCINFLFVFFVTDYVLREEEKKELKRLHDTIKQDKKILYKINSVALYDLDIYTLNTNLNIFYNNENIVKIEIKDNIGVHLNFEDEYYNKSETIKSVIELTYKNERLGLLNVFYTKALINEHFEEFKKEVISFAFILTCILSFVIYFLIKQFTKPIIKLSDATDKISSGNLDYTIDIYSDDEVGQLAFKFRHMQDSLKEKISSLSNKNDELSNEILQRNKIEKNLIEAYNIINKSPAVVFLCKNEPGFPVEYVSSNVYNLFGYKENYFTKTKVNLKNIVLDDDLRKAIYKMLDNQNTFKMNFGDFEDKPFKIKTKDGVTKWISIKTYEKLDIHGDITHFQGLMIDVTSEINALNKLSESKLHYQNLIENNIASIMIKTSKNNIVMTNKRARELFGLTNTQLEGVEELPSTWKVFNTYGDEIGLEQMPSNRIFETRDKVFNEIIGILHSNSDEIIWILVNAYAEFDKHGNIQRVISSSIDISEIKKAENKVSSLNNELERRVKTRTRELTKSKKELQRTVDTLQQAQEQLVQNEKMASLGNLVAGVAHEINTPVGSSLTGITHMVSETNALEKLYREDEMSQEEFEEYLLTLKEIGTSITISLQQAASLIKSFKQVAVDQSHSELRDFFVKQYMDEILLSIKTKIRETNIKVKVSCEQTIMTRSYPGAFSQVITNLILNSLLHAYEKDDEGLITIDIQEESDDLKITYKDDGKGISEANLKKIYEPFFTTKRSEGGSGLGMHIIYNIVMSNLHGRINCISKEGSGVTFIIYMKKNLGLI